MSNEAIRTRLREALQLKALPRAGWVRVGVCGPESVAAHSWGTAFLTLVLCPEALDRERAMALAIVHDLPEVRVGDLTPHDMVAKADKQRAEAEAMAQISQDLPGGESLVALWREYDEGATPEARFVKACDKLDMALQAAIYGTQQGLDLSEFVESALARIDDQDLRALAAESTAEAAVVAVS